MIYSLYVDDLVTGRGQARDVLDAELAKPLDGSEPEPVAPIDDPEWGLTPDAVAAAEDMDAYFPEEGVGG